MRAWVSFGLIPWTALNRCEWNVIATLPIRISSPGLIVSKTARSSRIPLSDVPLLLVSMTNAWSVGGDDERLMGRAAQPYLEVGARDLGVVEHQPAPLADPRAFTTDE